jgi:hypothetical protein
MSIMEKFIEYMSGSFFTNLIAFLVANFGLFYSLLKGKGAFRIFTLYFFSYSITQLAFYIINFLHDSELLKYQEFALYLDFSFTILEFYIFSGLILIALKNYKNPLIYITLLIFSVIAFNLLFKDLNTFGEFKLETLEKIFIYESVLLIIPCLVYFYHLFENPNPLPLRNDPYFWITTGLSFFLLTTLPFSLFMNSIRVENLDIYDYLYSITCLFYSLLFIMIIKAISCRTMVAT